MLTGMLTGRCFKLRAATVAMDVIGGRRGLIPPGVMLKVVPGPSDGDRMVDVLWEGHIFAMFAIDVKERGVEVDDT